LLRVSVELPYGADMARWPHKTLSGNRMNVTVVGTGYVGLVAGACFAESGNDVICVDNNPDKIEALNRGEIPIYEPGLEEIVKNNAEGGRLRFTTDLKDGVERAEVIFIAVGTPQDEDGSADLTYVLAVAKGIGQNLNGYKVIVDKSTVPVGTAAKVAKTIREFSKHEFDVVSNPEFLKEGSAVDDFLKPDRVVIGVDNLRSERVMKELYAPFIRTNNPILVMDVVSAEMTKYAANAMLATRVSFMNEISLLCERVGADVDAVRRGMGTDSRIGKSFLFPGIGYGGSCFPKDVQALIRTAKDNDFDLKISQAVEDVNKRQKTVLVDKILKHYNGNVKGKTFAIWGLAFKPKTDDVREAPALYICKALSEAGCSIKAFDPEANKTFARVYGEDQNLTYCENSYDALAGADALIICTEWNEFRNPNFERIKERLKDDLIFDGRNIYSLEEMADKKFTYYPIGRNPVKAGL
jgi:UDPglucose 6-dehydrogenase